MPLIDFGLREVLLYALVILMILRYTLITVSICGIWSGALIISAAQGELYYYLFGLTVIGLSCALLVFKFDNWRDDVHRKRGNARRYSESHDEFLS